MWLSSDVHRSPGRILLYPGLLDASVDLDTRDLDSNRRRWRSSRGSSRSRQGGSAALCFIFELPWRICIEERVCAFCIASLLSCKFALSFATPVGAQINYTQYPAGGIFALPLRCWTQPNRFRLEQVASCNAAFT
jgi:hypothetical protein